MRMRKWKITYLKENLILYLKYFIPTVHNVYIDGLPAISATDCIVGKHITPFGICREQSKKASEDIYCNPKIAYNKWLESCLKMKVGDEDSVNENSYLICTRCEGARIYPVLGSGVTDEGLGIEEQIQALMNQITGEEIKSYKYADMVNLPTVEILARMIYQEDHCPDNGRQNAIAFSVVNRLCSGGCNLTDSLGEKKDNNLYGIVTAGGQYKSIFDAEEAKKSTASGNYNAYNPPTDSNASESEKEGWENAKRLAAILYIAVDEYGNGEYTERGRCVEVNNNSVRENIIEFMEKQVDNQGNEIKNNIGDYRSFRRLLNNKSVSDYIEEGKIVILDENGNAVGNVFQK